MYFIIIYLKYDVEFNSGKFHFHYWKYWMMDANNTNLTIASVCGEIISTKFNKKFIRKKRLPLHDCVSQNDWPSVAKINLI